MKQYCFLLVVFLLCMLFVVTACGKSSPVTTAVITTDLTGPTESFATTKESTMSTTPITTPISEGPKPTTVTIDTSFKVIYSASASNAEKAAANKIVTAMSHFGVTLSIEKDNKPQNGNEIIIGKTTRAESQSATQALLAGSYTLQVCENQSKGVSLLLAAVDDTGIELALKHLIINYLSLDKKATLPYTLCVTHTQSNVTVQDNYQLSEYTLVYAKEGTHSDVNIQSAKYADAARDFAALVEKFTGHTLTVVPDTSDVSSYPHVIFFGNTSAIEDDIVYSALFYKKGISSYNVRMFDNGNISLAGTNPISAYAAGEAFLATIAENNNSISEINLSGKKDIIHVACLGDSITFGTGSADPSMQSYPVYYQRMLGYDYYVEKYGVPSHSLIETDQPSFLNHDYFKKSANAKPDVVIVMLGTNDSRPTRWADSAYKDWSDPARKQAFLDAGDKLVANYRAANPDVQIIFATCPTVPQAADWTACIKNNIIPCLNEIAKKNNCLVIDIFSFTQKNVYMFAGSDRLHLKDENYEILAQGFYDLTKNLIKK